MHIFAALIQDHEKVKELLTELVSLDETDHESRDDLVQDIRDELIPHSRAEESIFYNSLRALETEQGLAADKSKVMHSFQEHMEAEGLLRMLQVEDKINLSWKATAKKLKDAVEHHIRQEESEIFAIARKVLTQEEAKTLGELFEKVKPQIQDENFLKTSLEMVANMMPPRFTTAIKKLAS